MPGLEPVPYPNDRYQSTLLWWDLESTHELADPRQRQLISQEAAQLDQADDRLVLMTATG